jgi:drug/metabolite transporter (DMT)-like permease
MNSKNVYYILMLVAILWGFGISATKLVLDAGVGVNMFIFIRFLIGGVVVALFYKNLGTLSTK